MRYLLLALTVYFFASPSLAEILVSFRKDKADRVYLLTEGQRLELRRYSAAGEPDRDFGVRGTVDLTQIAGKWISGADLELDGAHIFVLANAQSRPLNLHAVDHPVILSLTDDGHPYLGFGDFKDPSDGAGKGLNGVARKDVLPKRFASGRGQRIFRDGRGEMRVLITDARLAETHEERRFLVSTRVTREPGVGGQNADTLAEREDPRSHLRVPNGLEYSELGVSPGTLEVTGGQTRSPGQIWIAGPGMLASSHETAIFVLTHDPAVGFRPLATVKNPTLDAAPFHVPSFDRDHYRLHWIRSGEHGEETDLQTYGIADGDPTSAEPFRLPIWRPQIGETSGRQTTVIGTTPENLESVRILAVDAEQRTVLDCVDLIGAMAER